MPSEEWLTLTEVCQLLKIGKITLRKWRKSGKIKDAYPDGRPLPGSKGGYTVRIARSEIDKLMREGSVEKLKP